MALSVLIPKYYLRLKSNALEIVKEIVQESGAM